MDPGTSQPPNPDPISNPLVAGMLSIACASLASSLSKQGSPSPTGTFRITQVTVPPMLSLLSRNVSITFDIRLLASSFGQRTGRKESTVFRSIVSTSFKNSRFVAAVGCSGVGGKRCSLPTDETKLTISTLWARRRYFSAMVPAATRPGGRGLGSAFLSFPSPLPSTREKPTNQLFRERYYGHRHYWPSLHISQDR